MTANGDLGITDPFNLDGPDFMPASNSPVLGGSYWSEMGIDVVPVYETLMVYPNPVSSTLYFGGDVPVKSVRLINMTGQVVRETKVTNNQLSVSDLVPGLYLIQTTLENGKLAMQKLYKQ